MNDSEDILIRSLREAWEGIDKSELVNCIIDNYIDKKDNSFRDILNSILIERKEDIHQIEDAMKLYNDILYNFNKGKQIFDTSALSFRDVIGKDICIFFKKDYRGLCCSDITFRRGEEEHKTRGIVVGSDVFDLEKYKNAFLFWKSFEDNIVHEFVHFNDKGRTKIVVSSDLSKPEEYFNHPFEFNAYFIQFAKYFYEQIKNGHKELKDFGDNEKGFVETFWRYALSKHPDIRKYINKGMLFKWNKRIYQLYEHLRGIR